MNHQVNRNPRSAPERGPGRFTMRGPSRLLGIGVLLSLGFTMPAFAEAVGTVTHSSGTVSVKRADGTTKLLGLRSEVHEGDRISTQSDTYTRVKFKDGGEVTLRPNSQVQVANYSFNESAPKQDNVVINLFKGGLRAITGLIGQRNKENVSFKTPTATIGIRGTNFGLLFCQADCGGVPTISGQPPADGLHLDVANGEIVASNPGGSLNFTIGQFGYVGGPNTPPVLVPPTEGIRVTIPPGFKSGEGSGRGVGSKDENQCMIQ